MVNPPARTALRNQALKNRLYAAASLGVVAGLIAVLGAPIKWS
jgi:hypothetical protein